MCRNPSRSGAGLVVILPLSRSSGKHGSLTVVQLGNATIQLVIINREGPDLTSNCLKRIDKEGKHGEGLDERELWSANYL